MGGGSKSIGKLLPILEMFLRELFWRFGWADVFFRKHVYPREEGEVYCALNLTGCYTQPVKEEDLNLPTTIKSLINIGSDFDVTTNAETDKTMGNILDNLVEEGPD